MRRLIYHSVATQVFDRDSLAGLVRSASRFNATCSVTGVLVYQKGGFLQVLEGSIDALDQVMKRIYLDTRHNEIFIVQNRPIVSRLFQDWSMHICDMAAHPAMSAALYDLEALKVSRQIREREIARMVDSLSAFYVAEQLAGE